MEQKNKIKSTLEKSSHHDHKVAVNVNWCLFLFVCVCYNFFLIININLLAFTCCVISLKPMSRLSTSHRHVYICLHWDSIYVCDTTKTTKAKKKKQAEMTTITTTIHLKWNVQCTSIECVQFRF